VSDHSTTDLFNLPHLLMLHQCCRTNSRLLNLQVSNRMQNCYDVARIVSSRLFIV